MVKPLWSYEFHFRNYEDDGKEEDAVKTYEKILKINPEDRNAINSINRIKELEREAQELGFDLKFVCFFINDIHIFMLDPPRSVFILNFFFRSLKGNPTMLAKFKEFLHAEKSKKANVSPDFRRHRTRSRYSFKYW